MTELHVHLDGSLRPATVYDLAKRSRLDTGIPNLYQLPRADAEERLKRKMIAPTDCRHLEDYLESFRLPLAVLRNEDAIECATYELGEDLYQDGVTHAEIRFAPLSLCGKDLTARDVIRSAERGARNAMRSYPGLTLTLILCCMRGQETAPFVEGAGEELQGPEVHFRLLDLIAGMRNDVIRAVDLAGAEAKYPTEGYRKLFRYATELQLPFTIHAGEADGKKSVRAAVEMGARRIGHGVRAIEDRWLVDTLVKKKITLECCLSSNFQTRCFPLKEDHPIKKLFDAGVRVTLNTDNRTVSDTTMQKEIGIAKRHFGFTDAEIRTMQEYAREAVF